jgi:hypothetical protein
MTTLSALNPTDGFIKSLADEIYKVDKIGKMHPNIVVYSINKYGKDVVNLLF